MKRYHMGAVAEFGPNAWPEEHESSTGDWVKYDDVKEEITSLTCERDEALTQSDMQIRLFKKAFQLVYEAYSKPADSFEYDCEYISFISGKVRRAFSAMQKVYTLASSANMPALAHRDSQMRAQGLREAAKILIESGFLNYDTIIDLAEEIEKEIVQ